MTDNLDIWNRLAHIDKKHIKPIVGRQYKGDSPKPQACFEKMTSVFGPVGTNWGFTVKERWREEFPDANGVVERIDACVLVEVKATTGPEWIPWQYIGQSKLMYWTSGAKPRRIIDDDAYKKAVTDALTKALAVIGVAAEIHMGELGDSKYLQAEEKSAPAKSVSVPEMAKEVFSEAKPEPQPEPKVPTGSSKPPDDALLEWPLPAFDSDEPVPEKASEEQDKVRKRIWQSAKAIFRGASDDEIHGKIHSLLPSNVKHIHEVPDGKPVNELLASLSDLAQAEKGAA